MSYYRTFMSHIPRSCECLPLVFSHSTHLSTPLVGDLLLLAVLIGQCGAPHTQLCFQGAWCVVDAAMNHTAVVTTLVHRWRWGAQTEAYNQCYNNSFLRYAGSASLMHLLDRQINTHTHTHTILIKVSLVYIKY